MTRIKLIICFITIPFLLFSEEKASDYNLGITISSGGSFFLYKKLNVFLKENGYFPVYNTIDDGVPFVCFGVELNNKNSPSYCRLSFQKTMHGNKNNTKSLISYTGVDCDMFYDFCKKDKWILAPMMGVSVLDVNLSAVSKNKISELTQVNLQEGLSKTTLFCIKPGFTVRRVFPVLQTQASIGIDCYYQIEIGDGKWRDVSNKKIDNFAASKMNGFVFCINSTIYFP